MTYAPLSIVKNTTALIALLTISGCEYTQRNLNTSSPWQWYPRAEVISFQQYLVRFGEKSATLSSSDKKALKDLYYSFQDLGRVNIRLGVSSLERVSESPQMNARLSQLHRYFQQLAIPDYHVHVIDKSLMPEADEQGRQNSIVVIFEEYTTIPPRCPEWNQVMNGRVPPEGEANFGCSTQFNLANMVANPSVLQKAPPHGNSDGTRSTLAVKDYRTDRVKALRTMQVSTIPDIGGLANQAPPVPNTTTTQ